mmetsp:Transcript_70934/g.140771  ORF Transcript_70934/g.140771 Transcript_70934/m.140771 type:complete len:247 (-) Transcript_70934:123-863(-)
MTRLRHRQIVALVLIYLLCTQEARAMHVFAVPAGVALGEAIAGGAAVGAVAAGTGGLAAAEVAVLEAGAANAWNPVGWFLLSAAAVGGVALAIGAASHGSHNDNQDSQMKTQFQSLHPSVQGFMTQTVLSQIDSTRRERPDRDCRDPACQQGVYCYVARGTTAYCGKTNNFNRRHSEHTCENIPSYMSTCEPRWFAREGQMVKVVCMKCCEKQDKVCEALCKGIETVIISACKGAGMCLENVQKSR